MTYATGFRTSHKPLSYYCDTPETQALMGKFGSHLQALNQEQKYQLITAISTWLWHLTCLAEGDLAPLEFDPDDYTIEYIFGESSYLCLDETVKASLAVLDDSEPDALAAMLAAIVLYAAEDASR